MARQSSLAIVLGMRVFALSQSILVSSLLVSQLAHAQVPEPAPAPPPATAPAPAPAPAPVAPAPVAPAPVAPTPVAPAPAAASAPAAAPAPATPPPVGYGYQLPPPVADTTVHRHDGFYLRLGLGVGNFSFTADVEEDGQKAATVETSGIVPMSEVAFGGTIAPGVVLGGGIYTAGTAGGSRDFDITPEGGGGSVSEELDTGPFGMVGPFIDIYPNPEQGLHIQAAVGFATYSVTEPSSESVDDISLTGLGLMAGVGYEWWIGEQWSFGILGRVMVGKLSGEDPSDSDETYSATAVAPGLLATITYH